MFKCLVSKHDDNCSNCLRVINWVDSDEVCFRFAVKFFNDKISDRNVIDERDIDVNTQFFEKLSDEIIFLIIFNFDDELLQTTLKFWVRFSFRIAIRKAFFRVFAFLFEMICWSAIQFITYEACFRRTNRKSIARTKVSQEFTIVTIIDRFTTILFIDEVMLDTIDVIAVVDALKIRVLLFIDWLVIDDIDIERIDQWRDIRWWIMQFDQ
jgi:hypothetical protein